jgi:hypothetical protein
MYVWYYQRGEKFGLAHLPLALLWNAVTAGNANTANRELMKKEEVWGKQIEPHSSITGILLFRGTSGDQPTFAFKN